MHAEFNKALQQLAMISIHNGTDKERKQRKRGKYAVKVNCSTDASYTGLVIKNETWKPNMCHTVYENEPYK